MHAERRNLSESITIGIPAFNEQANIERVVQEALFVGRDIGVELEVLVVDDASIDQTPSILAQLVDANPEVRVIRNSRNRGIGGSIAVLCAEAGKDLLFLNAADGQWRMSELLRMRDVLYSQSLDLVIGARARKRYTPYRKAVSWLFRVLCERLFGFRLWDPGSIILMRKSVRHIPVQSVGVFAHAERIIRAQAMGLQAGKADVEHFPRVSGRAQGASLANIVLALREGARFVAVYRRERDASRAAASVSTAVASHPTGHDP